MAPLLLDPSLCTGRGHGHRGSVQRDEETELRLSMQSGGTSCCQESVQNGERLGPKIHCHSDSHQRDG